MTVSMKKTRDSQRKHLLLLLLLAVGMFGFAFALVPFYEVFCELTGLNGKTFGRATVIEKVSQDPYRELKGEKVTNREVTIQFLAHVGNGLPWEFRPTESQLRVRLGEVNTTRFYVRNRASQMVTGQAVPSVAPGIAARYLQKIECFCFTQQSLGAGEEMEMPVTFTVGADLPEAIQTFSLSYTLFHVDQAETAPLKSDL